MKTDKLILTAKDKNKTIKIYYDKDLGNKMKIEIIDKKEEGSIHKEILITDDFDFETDV